MKDKIFKSHKQLVLKKIYNNDLILEIPFSRKVEQCTYVKQSLRNKVKNCVMYLHKINV